MNKDNRADAHIESTTHVRYTDPNYPGNEGVITDDLPIETLMEDMGTSRDPWVTIGKYFGYPDCCIRAFCNLRHLDDDCARSGGWSRFFGTGYVPCESCCKRTYEDVVAGINRDRMCPTDFPDQGDFKPREIINQMSNACDVADGQEMVKSVDGDGQTDWVGNTHFNKPTSKADIVSQYAAAITGGEVVRIEPKDLKGFPNIDEETFRDMRLQADAKRHAQRARERIKCILAGGAGWVGICAILSLALDILVGGIPMLAWAGIVITAAVTGGIVEASRYDIEWTL